MDSYTASPSELKLNAFVGDSLNRFLRPITTRQSWHRRVHSRWHNGLWGVKSSMEVFTEQVTGRPIASSLLDSCDAENVMSSLKWLGELWALARVSGFTEKIYFIVRMSYCGSIGNIQYAAIFSSITTTVCNFCIIFADPQHTKDKLVQDDNWPVEVN